MLVQSPHTHDGLSNTHPRNGSLWLSESPPHPSLEPISSGTRQHFVNPNNVEGMEAHPYVELILPCRLDEVLVGTNTSCLQCLRGQLLVLIRDKMDTEGEVLHSPLLLPQVKDPDLGIRHTTTEPGLWVRLVLAVPVTSRRSTSHDDDHALKDDPVSFD